MLCLVGLVGVNVGTYCVNEFGEARCEVWALGVDGLCVNCLSDFQ